MKPIIKFFITILLISYSTTSTITMKLGKKINEATLPDDMQPLVQQYKDEVVIPIMNNNEGELHQLPDTLVFEIFEDQSTYDEVRYEGRYVNQLRIITSKETNIKYLYIRSDFEDDPFAWFNLNNDSVTHKQLMVLFGGISDEVDGIANLYDSANKKIWEDGKQIIDNLEKFNNELSKGERALYFILAINDMPKENFKNTNRQSTEEVKNEKSKTSHPDTTEDTKKRIKNGKLAEKLEGIRDSKKMTFEDLAEQTTEQPNHSAQVTREQPKRSLSQFFGVVKGRISDVVQKGTDLKNSLIGGSQRRRMLRKKQLK
jgi:hypothetical protein